MNPKQAAAEHGAGLVKSGMVLGLGSGTTSTLMVQAVGRKLREGTLRDVSGVPSSSGIAAVARESGVPLTTLDDQPRLDLNLDGADEVDPNLGLIKGLGGALLWEKIGATASRQVVILVDDTKLVTRLGTKAPLPVEVVPFGWKTHLAFVESLGGKPTLRTEPDGRPFVTDEGNYILHCRFEVYGAGADAATPLSAEVSPNEMVGLLNEIFSHFDSLIDLYGVEKIETVGDEYMAACGVPRPHPQHAQAIARLALDMSSYMASLTPRYGRRLEVRIGIHSGPIVAGVIGRKKFAFELFGDTVNTANRMQSHGVPSRIQVTRATFELLKDEFVCEPRGPVMIKGKGEMETWFLVAEKQKASEQTGA